jgi:hypothetical protein
MPEIIDLIKYISKKIKVAFQKPIVWTLSSFFKIVVANQNQFWQSKTD